jgi:hypothetical protein
MTRPELAATLAALVANGDITQAQADEVLRLYDAGELTPAMLPVTERRGMDSQDVATALGVVVLLLWSRFARSARLLMTAGSGIVVNNAPAIVPSMARRRVRDTLQRRFERQANTNAELIATGAGVAAWHTAMQDSVREHIAAQMVAGTGRPLSAGEMTLANGLMIVQLAFLARFAVQVAVRWALGDPYSRDYIANRAGLYSGAGWEAWHRGNERVSAQEPFTVVYYVARDDGSTCGPCATAAGDSPYLPGNHPMPGAVCLGRGRCRCTLRYDIDRAAWLRLQGRAA